MNFWSDCFSFKAGNTPEHALNLASHAKICPVLPKNFIMHRHIWAFHRPIYVAGVHPRFGKTTNWRVHTVHGVRQPRRMLGFGTLWWTNNWWIGAHSAWGKLSLFAVAWRAVYSSIQRKIRLALGHHMLRCIPSLISKGASTSAREHKWGRPRWGIREHMPWLQHEAKCCHLPSQWMILFEEPTPGG